MRARRDDDLADRVIEIVVFRCDQCLAKSRWEVATRSKFHPARAQHSRLPIARKELAPQVGLEPTTLRLTAGLGEGRTRVFNDLNGAKCLFWSAFVDKRFQVWSRGTVPLWDKPGKSQLRLSHSPQAFAQLKSSTLQRSPAALLE